jgi:hypothetical protein
LDGAFGSLEGTFLPNTWQSSACIQRKLSPPVLVGHAFPPFWSLPFHA